MSAEGSSAETQRMFDAPDWYDRTIDWAARLGREIPVLMDELKAPGTGGLIDAGCGTGRQACALAERGYRVVGVDASDEMVRYARARAEAKGLSVKFVCCNYAAMSQTLGGGFDGLYCLGNSLAAAGSRDAAAEAVRQFGACLRPGGRLFVQILNFTPMRRDVPCVRGPRVTTVDGRDYVSVRQFHFTPETVSVTNITVYNDGAWRHHAHGGTLYPVALEELRSWCNAADLRVDAVYGSYAREPLDPDRSVDVILTATRT